MLELDLLPEAPTGGLDADFLDPVEGLQNHILFLPLLPPQFDRPQGNNQRQLGKNLMLDQIEKVEPSLFGDSRP